MWDKIEIQQLGITRSTSLEVNNEEEVYQQHSFTHSEVTQEQKHHVYDDGGALPATIISACINSF